MSSFPTHEKNILDLQDMGFDVSESIEGGEVTLDSWGYDSLVDTMEGIIKVLQQKGFKVE